MKRALLALVSAFALMGAVTFAHGDAVHVRGTVTQINGQSVTIQPTGKGAKAMTFTVADHTGDRQGRQGRGVQGSEGRRPRRRLKSPRGRPKRSRSRSVRQQPRSRQPHAAEHKHKG